MSRARPLLASLTLLGALWSMAGGAIAQQVFVAGGASAPALKALPKNYPLPSKIIGQKARSRVTPQDPFPICYATAAVSALEALTCPSGSCPAERRPSVLALSIFGSEAQSARVAQGLMPLGIPEGGDAMGAIQTVLAKGSMSSHAECNYDAISDGITTQAQAQQKNASLRALRSKLGEWNAQRGYSRYYERWQRREVMQIATQQLSLPEATAASALDKAKSVEEALALMIYKPECSAPARPLILPKISVDHINLDIPNPAAAAAYIEKMVSRGPVMATFCVMKKEGGWLPFASCPTRHIATILAQGRTVDALGQTRLTYWLSNTWGEWWQSENRDGWVLADEFLDAVQGEVISLSLDSKGGGKAPSKPASGAPKGVKQKLAANP